MTRPSPRESVRVLLVSGGSLGLLLVLAAQTSGLVHDALGTGADPAAPVDERVAAVLTTLVAAAATGCWAAWCRAVLCAAAAWATDLASRGNPARPSASRQRVCATRGWRRAAAVALGLTALGATAPAAADGGGGAGRHCVLEVAGARPAEPALDGLPLPDLPAPRPRSSPPPDGGPASGAELVRVRPGDTLWSLAAARLAPAAPDSAVDRLWRGWYAANRPVIGPDPDLLQPGQLLRPPDVPSSPRTAP